MPVLIPVVIAIASAAASYGVGAYLVAAGFSALTGAIIGGMAGAVVAFAGNALAASIMGAGKSKKDATSGAQDAKRTVRNEVAPRRVVYGYRRVSGPLIYVASTGDKNQFLHLVVPLADHAVHAISAVWIGTVPVVAAEIDASGNVTAGPLAGKVRIRRYLGTQTTADPDLVTESPDGWTAADKLTGIAYVYVRLEFDADKFQNGVPSISADVLGKKVLDPRSSTTAYSTNWALVIYDYLRSEHGIAATADEIDVASIIAAANLSDENVQITAAGETQDRYQLNGTFTLDQQPIDVLEEMLAAGGGALVYTAGKYRLYGGAYATPSLTLTADDIAGPAEVVTKPPRRQLFNSVRGNYINNYAYWQAAAFPPIELASAITEDGEQIWRELELNWVLDQTYAQRIAKQLLYRSRQGVTIRVPVKYANLNLAVWDMVAVTLDDLGWSAKPFRIMSWTFTPENGVIMLTMQEEQIASYAWTYDEGASAPEFPDTTFASVTRWLTADNLAEGTITSTEIQSNAVTNSSTAIASNVFTTVGSYNDLMTVNFTTTTDAKRVILVSVECSDESAAGVANTDSVNWQSYLRLKIGGTVQSGEVDSVCQSGTTTAITWSFLDSTSRTGSIAFALQGKAVNFGGATRTKTGFRDPTMTILELKR